MSSTFHAFIHPTSLPLIRQSFIRPSLTPIPRTAHPSIRRPVRAVAVAAATKSQPPPIPKPPSINPASILRLTSPEWKSLSIGILASLISSSVLLLTPITFGRVLDTVSTFHLTGTTSGLKALNKRASRLLCVYIFSTITRLAEVALMRVAGERIVASLRSRVFKNIVHADVAMLESTTTGELMSRLSADTAALQTTMTEHLVKFIQGALETLVAGVMLFVLCRQLALTIYLTIPLSIIAGFYYGSRTARLAKSQSGSLAKLSSVASEQLNGIRIVKSFAREPFAEKLYNDKIRDTLRIGYKSAVADGILQAWNRCIFSFVTCAILLFGGRLIAAGSLSIGSMMAFVLYTSNLSNAVAKLSSGVGELLRATGSVERIADILDTKPSIERSGKMGSDVSGRLSLNGCVEFRDVTFRYGENERTVLHNVGFKIPAGGSAAFVGGSGGGKSTTLALMSRFFEPTSGDILLDGRPLKEYDVREVRKSVIGIVSQEPFLISGTIADNIAYGRPGATEAEIREAAEAAGVMEYAWRLTDGLDTTVRRLSGGEQQRLMIARCLVKNPSIVVLDEPTSALDGRNEAIVNATIERLIYDGSRTVILISHRLESVKNFDSILVFERGTVVEQGSHEELLGQEGVYSQLLKGSKEEE